MRKKKTGKEHQKDRKKYLLPLYNYNKLLLLSHALNSIFIAFLSFEYLFSKMK